MKGWMKRIASRLTKTFVVGLIIMMPVLMTYWVGKLIFGWLDGLLQGIQRLPHIPDVPGIGVILVLSIIFLVGIVGSNVLGKKLVRLGQQVALLTPGIRSVYSPLKQIAEALTTMQEKIDSKPVVLVEYPTKGLFSLALRTNTMLIDGKLYSAVTFLSAITLQPVFTALIPNQDVKEINLPMKQFATFTVSAGVVGIEAINTIQKTP